MPDVISFRVVRCCMDNRSEVSVKRGQIQFCYGDMADKDEDLSKYRLLSTALRRCSEIINPTYDIADESALRNQKYHRFLTNFAVSSGTLAVLLAVVQLTGFVPAPLPMWVEVLAALMALSAVILGIVQSRQALWLLQRHKAERCRLLKFRSLIHPDLWTKNPQQSASWENRLHKEMTRINDLTPQSLKEWAERRDITDVPHGISQCSIDVGTLRALVDYFVQKRINVQMEYFERRSNQYQGIDRYLRNLPPILFFVSVFVVFGHFATDVVLNPSHSNHKVSVILIALAVSLPVTGAAIRSIRSAHEFARSACLYRAKHEALKRISDRLGKEEDCVEILLTLWHCEQFLESEHREWLRLMTEAEWFG